MALAFTIDAARILNQFLPTPFAVGKTNVSADSSIGCPMVMEVDVTVSSPDTVGGCTWSFSPALFIGPSLPASSGVAYFRVSIPAGVSSGTYAMELFTDNAFVETQRNFSAVLQVISSTTARVRLFFRMTMDVEGFLSQNELPNWKRLRRSHRMATGFENVMASVYRNTNRRGSFKLKVQNEAGEFLQLFGHIPFASRYYFRGLPTVETEPPAGSNSPNGEFSAGYELRFLRGGEVVETLSPFADTTVEVLFNTDAALTLQEKAMVYLMKQSPFNASHFLADYGTVGSVFTSAATEGQDFGYGILGVAGCFDTVTIEGQEKHRIRFKVAASFLDTNVGLYAMAIVIGGAPVADPDNTFTNSFLQESISLQRWPDPLPMDGSFSGTLADYNEDPETDNVVTTVVDHLRAIVNVNAESYDEAAPFVSNWGADLRVIRLRFMDMETVLWEREYTRDGAQFVSSVKAAAGNVIEEVVEGQVYTYRTTLSMCYPNDAGLPDFSNRVVRVVWSFEMWYPAYALAVRYEYPQQFAVNGYQAFADVIKSITLREYETGLPVQNLCITEQVLVEVLLDPTIAGDETWNIRAFWSLEGHGYRFNNEGRPGHTRESEAYESPSGELEQISDASLLNLPETFDSNGRALFVFDHSQVPVGQRARLHVIAQPQQFEQEPISCEGEGYSQLITQAGGIVYIESESGYWALRNSDGNVQVFESGTDHTIEEAGTYCVFACTEDGGFANGITFVYVDEGVENMQFTTLAATLENVEAILSTTGTVDFSECALLESAYVITTATAVVVDGCSSLLSFNCECEATSINMVDCVSVVNIGLKFNGTSLDVSTMPGLDQLAVEGPLSAIDLSNNTQLLTLNITGSNIATLDLSANVLLNFLIAEVQCSSIDLTSNTALSICYVKFPGNTLNITGLAVMDSLNAEFGGIEAIGLSTCVALKTVELTYSGNSLDLTNQPDLNRLTVVSPGMVTVQPHPTSKLRNVLIVGASMSSTSVDLICARLDDTVSGFATNISGGTSASPSALVLASISNYIAAGNSFLSN